MKDNMMALPRYWRWIGVISGMIIWAVWFVTVYALGSIGCAQGWNRIDVAGGNLLSLILLLSTGLALALICWSAVRGYQGWRHGTHGMVAGQEARQRITFMGLTMLVVSSLAAVGTLMIGIPILMLEPCAT